MSFDHRDVGTPESSWAADPLLAAAPELDLAGAGRLVVLAAHPDDESLGAGGLLAHAERAGLAVTVLVATAGEGSHPRSTTVDPGQLAELRRGELRRALAHVTPDADVRLLDLPDGGLAGREDRMVDALRPVVDASTVIAAPWRGDGHPDHEAAGRAAAQVAAAGGATLLEYPVWMWHWARPGDGRVPYTGLRRLTLDADALSRKAAAVSEHRSQVEALSELPGDEPVVPASFATHFARAFESYVVTTPAPRSLGPEYFAGVYATGTDPWGFETRWYERRKRALTLASLPRERFRRGFEPGCSIGVLTAELAQRCDSLLAADVSEAALDRARERLRNLPGVRLEQRQVPRDWPSGTFDLVVLSEVGYYSAGADLADLVRCAVTALEPDGVLVACHWRHPVADYPTSGDDVHAALLAHPELAVLARHEEEDFLLDVLVPAPAVSVARAEGLL